MAAVPAVAGMAAAVCLAPQALADPAPAHAAAHSATAAGALMSRDETLAAVKRAAPHGDGPGPARQLHHPVG